MCHLRNFQRGQSASLQVQIRHVTGGVIHDSGPRPPVIGYLIDAGAICAIPRHLDCGERRRMPSAGCAGFFFQGRCERHPAFELSLRSLVLTLPLRRPKNSREGSFLVAERVGAPHSLLHSLSSWHSLRLWFFPVTQDDASCAVSLCEIRVEFHHPTHLCHTTAADQWRFSHTRNQQVHSRESPH